MVEDLDAARDGAAVTQEELASRQAEMINKRLYVLSIVAAIFLPLGLVTGVLGVNLGGIPGSDWPYGFTVLCVIMAGLISAQFWIFRKLGWF
jgi:zinc transporter